ncbi:hypothetical protein C0995_011579 [Termitomyces sp. Mi166|nr:hypothetical protein C0995_011579 [Termitomyces sp. Mi166\
MEDSDNSQSITKDLDRLCRTLSESQEITYIDCKWLDSNIQARLKYVESLEKWIAQARGIKELQLAALGDMEVKTIAFRVFHLEQGLGRKGIDVRSMVQARLSDNSSASNSVESSGFKEAQKDGTMESLNDLENYREALRQMDEYERSRDEDNALMEKLDTKSTNLIQKIEDRLCIIDDERSTNSASFSRDILSVLISDKIADIVADKAKETVNFMDVFATLEIDTLTESLVEDVWKRIQPSLAVVDAAKPQRR